MNDQDKTKEQLIAELQTLRQQVKPQSAVSPYLPVNDTTITTIMDVFPGRVVILSPDGLYLDELIADHPNSHYAPPNRIGMTLHEVHGAEFADYCLQVMSDVLTHNDVRVIEYKLIAPTGETLYKEAHVAPIISPNGQRNIIWVVRDLTKRQTAQRGLRDNQELLDKFIESLPHRAVILNEDGVYLHVVKRRQDETKFQTANVVGKSLYDLQPKEFADYCIQTIQQTLTTQTTQLIEYSLVNQVNQLVYYEGRLLPLTPLDDGTRRILWVSLDITERKKREQQIQADEARFRLISSMTSDYAFSYRYNDEGTLENTFLTGAFETITGYTQHEFVANPALREQILHPDDQTQNHQDMEQLRSNQRVTSELRFITKQGDIRWVRIYYHPVWDTEEHTLLGFDGGVQDINQRKLAELELERYKDQLEALVKERTAELQQEINERQQLEAEKVRNERLAAVGQLAAGIAHDFNNVMAVIMLDSSMISRMGDLSSRQQQKIERIQKQAHHASKLIEQILDFSRRSAREPQILDLRVLLSELIKFLQRTIPEQVQLSFNYSAGDYSISADPTQIQQVMTNLAVNAKDAIEGNGTLDFRLSHFSGQPLATAPTGDWVQLSVSDSGSGIPSDVIDRIFEPFFTTKEVGKGTGLGLAQVYGIMQQHEGFITVDSKPNQGTTFNLFFPEVISKIQELQIVENDKLISGNNETILLVEDNADLLDSLSTILETFDYHVLTATNGEEALQVYANHASEINLILTDIVMPKMTGSELANHLLTYDNPPPIIMMSGFAHDAQNMQKENKLVVDSLAKPIDIAELAPKIQQAIAIHKQVDV